MELVELAEDTAELADMAEPVDMVELVDTQLEEEDKTELAVDIQDTLAGNHTLEKLGVVVVSVGLDKVGESFEQEVVGSIDSGRVDGALVGHIVLEEAAAGMVDELEGPEEQPDLAEHAVADMAQGDIQEQVAGKNSQQREDVAAGLMVMQLEGWKLQEIWGLPLVALFCALRPSIAPLPSLYHLGTSCLANESCL